MSNDNPFGRELLWWETDYEDQELWEEAHPIEWDELQEAYDQRRSTEWPLMIQHKS